MDHGLELFIPDPGNIWKFEFYNFPISWKYWKSYFFYVLPSWKYWKMKSSTFSIILEIFDIVLFPSSHSLEILIIDFSFFFISWKYLLFPLFSHILEMRAAGGRLQGLGSGGLDYFWNMFLEKRAW